MYDLGFLASGVGRFYEDMLVPFTFFASRSNPHSFVEIIVRDPARFEAIYSEELVAIREAVGTSFLIRKFQNTITLVCIGILRYQKYEGGSPTSLMLT